MKNGTPWTQQRIVKIVVALVLVALGTWLQSQQQQQQQPSEVQSHRLPIIYTKHARCRMGCRSISEKEIFDVIDHGLTNQRKSDAQAQPCPVVAKEKRTEDDQNVRVIYGLCEANLKIITVIDLGHEHDCNCD